MLSKRKVINNAKWIIVCKVIQAVLQLVIGMLCARYLGPSNYGVINYAASVVAFVVPLMQLGLQSTLVQELIESPEKEGKIMGTSLVLDLVSSFLCVSLVTAFVSTVNRGETETIIVSVLYSLSLVFPCTDEYEQAAGKRGTLRRFDRQRSRSHTGESPG